MEQLQQIQIPFPDPAPVSVSVSVPDFSNKFAECLSASEAETNLWHVFLFQFQRALWGQWGNSGWKWLQEKCKECRPRTPYCCIKTDFVAAPPVVLFFFCLSRFRERRERAKCFRQVSQNKLLTDWVTGWPRSCPVLIYVSCLGEVTARMAARLTTIVFHIFHDFPPGSNPHRLQ